jgi:hypothetical protein
MNQLLDLNALVSDDKFLEKNTLQTFEGVLLTCHGLIKRYNKEQVKQMTYVVPKYIFGKPMFDVAVLTNFLIYHLTDNGLFVREIKANELYISWNDKDINIDRFVERKKQIAQEQKDVMLGNPVHRMDAITQLRFRQERQQMASEARQIRFQQQETLSEQDKYRRYQRFGR